MSLIMVTKVILYKRKKKVQCCIVDEADPNVNKKDKICKFFQGFKNTLCLNVTYL